MTGIKKNAGMLAHHGVRFRGLHPRTIAELLYHISREMQAHKRGREEVSLP